MTRGYSGRCCASLTPKRRRRWAMRRRRGRAGTPGRSSPSACCGPWGSRRPTDTLWPRSSERNVRELMASGPEIEGGIPPPIALLDRPDAGAKVIRGGAIRGSVYAAAILLTAATVPLMTRHLGVIDFGRFVTASSIVMIVAGVTEFGLSAVGTREYALASPSERRALLANLLGLRTALTII